MQHTQVTNLLPLLPKTLIQLLIIEKQTQERTGPLDFFFADVCPNPWSVSLFDFVLGCLGTPYSESPEMMDWWHRFKEHIRGIYQHHNSSPRSIKDFLSWLQQALHEIYINNPDFIVERTKREYALGTLVQMQFQWRDFCSNFQAAGIDITWAKEIDLLPLVFEELGKASVPEEAAQLEKFIHFGEHVECLEYLEWVKRNA